MDRQRVLDALDVLRGELARAQQLEPAARAELERMTSDIQRLVEKQPTEHEPNGGEASGLQDALLEFEAEHPQLTGAINQVAAALANLGI
jgi:hypothetical protein